MPKIDFISSSTLVASPFHICPGEMDAVAHYRTSFHLQLWQQLKHVECICADTKKSQGWQVATTFHGLQLSSAVQSIIETEHAPSSLLHSFIVALSNITLVDTGFMVGLFFFFPTPATVAFVLQKTKCIFFYPKKKNAQKKGTFGVVYYFYGTASVVTHCSQIVGSVAAAANS